MSIQMKAGFARVDITPEFSVPLGGYGDEERRMSQVNLDPLYATCVAVSDGENKVLFYHLDLTGCKSEVADYCKAEIEKTYGIPRQNIFFTVTHTHSAPALNCGMECITKYINEVLQPGILAAAGPALEDLEEAELYIGSGKTDGLNFVRRYLLSDGTYGGDNFGDFKKNNIVAHETEADPTMQVLRWKRRTKKDILMVNWQAHPHRTGGFRKFELSSDLIEHFRKTVEASNKYLFAYYQGCSGNLNTHSRLASENTYRTPDYYADDNKAYKTHGRCLGQTCFDIVENKMRPVKAGKIRTLEKVFEGPVNHAWDNKVDDAKRVTSLWKDGKSDEARALALELGFNSVYHCNAVITRSTMPETISYKIYAASFGDFAFVASPNELYDTTGIYLKNSSPFEMTFVCGYTNAHGAGYMPTTKAFAHGGYGCDTCRFPAGTAEKLADAMLGLLVQLYDEK